MMVLRGLEQGEHLFRKIGAVPSGSQFCYEFKLALK